MKYCCNFFFSPERQQLERDIAVLGYVSVSECECVYLASKRISDLFQNSLGISDPLRQKNHTF